jgi:hypothetical protein
MIPTVDAGPLNTLARASKYFEVKVLPYEGVQRIRMWLGVLFLGSIGAFINTGGYITGNALRPGRVCIVRKSDGAILHVENRISAHGIANRVETLNLELQYRTAGQFMKDYGLDAAMPGGR